VTRDRSAPAGRAEALVQSSTAGRGRERPEGRGWQRAHYLGPLLRSRWSSGRWTSPEGKWTWWTWRAGN